MSDISYRFRVRLGNFELEVEGDRNYVEKTLNRYEGRFLPKLQGLIQSLPSEGQTAAISSKTASTSSVAPKSGSLAAKKSRARSNVESGRAPKSGRRKQDSGRGRRKYNKNANSRVMAAPVLPSDQEVIKQPYIPPDGFDMDEAIKPPPPLIERTGASAVGAEAKGGKENDGLRALFEELAPRTHHEKVMVFGYFLQERMGRKDFGTGKIRSCYEAAGIDLAGNISQVLNHATRTGFVTKEQRGRSLKYSLTSKGKQFVERGLQKS